MYENEIKDGFRVVGIFLVIRIWGNYIYFIDVLGE